MDVLVVGGTGTLGRHIVTALRQSGHRARIFSRNPRGHVDAVQGDLRTGVGVDKALAGMHVLVHAASATRHPLRASSTDVGGTRRLLESARAAGVRHVVFTSIVGIDRVAYPYYRTKLKAEQVVRESEVPWTILRATQFHDFVDHILGAFSRVPRITAVPFDWQLQPVDASDVARRVVAVVLAEPAGILPDFGGPEIRDLRSLAEAWLAARGDRRRLVNLTIPLQASRDIAAGNLLCPEHRDGRTTFEDYLAARYPAT